jgi:hypothetical protein
MILALVISIELTNKQKESWQPNRLRGLKTIPDILKAGALLPIPAQRAC